MQKLTFTNQRGQTLTIGYSRPYFIQNLVGLSDAPIDLLSARGYQQDGQTAAGQYFQARSITFSISVFGNDLEEIFQNRRSLLAFLNPKDNFTIVYQNDYLTVKFYCRVDAAPGFTSTQSNKGKNQYCAVSLICDNPYLFDIQETGLLMLIEEDALYFPLLFADEIIFSTTSSKQSTINNIGDVETPVRIQFHGATTNPTITNETTGEFIKVNKTILANEILEVSTGYGDKRVEIIAEDGTRTNAFQYIDLTSTFFQLDVGDNLITYSADSGADSAQVYVYYTNRYVGV